MDEAIIHIQGSPRDIYSLAALKQELQEIVDAYLDNAQVEEVKKQRWT